MMKRLAVAVMATIAIGDMGGVAHGQEVAGVAPAKLAEEGGRIYSSQCSRCHGYHMVNNGLVGFDLRKFPDDHDRFVNSVGHGKPPRMPPWGDVLSAKDIEALWVYVRTGGQQ